MPHFGRQSAMNLDTCDPRLIALANETLLIGMDFTVTGGHRGEEAQNEAYHAGLSKLKWPDSLHNSDPSKAVHFVPYPVNWKDLNRFYHLAGLARAVADRMGIGIRWGGDWDGDFDLRDQTFMDLAHYELIGG